MLKYLSKDNGYYYFFVGIALLIIHDAVELPESLDLMKIMFSFSPPPENLLLPKIIAYSSVAIAPTLLIAYILNKTGLSFFKVLAIPLRFFATLLALVPLIIEIMGTRKLGFEIIYDSFSDFVVPFVLVIYFISAQFLNLIFWGLNDLYNDAIYRNRPLDTVIIKN
jgi:hypothetical protein